MSYVNTHFVSVDAAFPPQIPQLQTQAHMPYAQLQHVIDFTTARCCLNDLLVWSYSSLGLVPHKKNVWGELFFTGQVLFLLRNQQCQSIWFSLFNAIHLYNHSRSRHVRVSQCLTVLSRWKPFANAPYIRYNCTENVRLAKLQSHKNTICCGIMTQCIITDPLK